MKLLDNHDMSNAESADFWKSYSKDELAKTAASLTAQNRVLIESAGYNEVMAFRKCLALLYVRGSGAEVGAGDRPWPIGPTETCFYGDVRDTEKLVGYFKNADVSFDGHLNAQTFEGVRNDSFDFVLSGHVIEHLPDPIGSIRETMRVLKPRGVFLLAVPEMRHTLDCDRPPTSLQHLLDDERDGGASTRLQAYEDHVRYVHTRFHPAFSESQIAGEVHKIAEAGMDIHWHAWTCDTFREMLEEIRSRVGFKIEHQVSIQNEMIFVLRKLSS